jgi:hypothetical protein
MSIALGDSVRGVVDMAGAESESETDGAVALAGDSGIRLAAEVGRLLSEGP